MDRNITAWFYLLTPATPDGNAVAVEAILDQAFALNPVGNRERDLSATGEDALIVRLERLTHNGDFVSGQFTRIQKIGIPPEATTVGLTEMDLDDQSGLGHTVAFRYHKPSRVMAIQYNMAAIGALKICRYLDMISVGNLYRARRVPAADQWANYNAGVPQKFKLKIATPANPEEVEPEGSVGNMIQILSEMMGSPYITIEATMGNRQGSLNKGGVRGFFNNVVGSLDVRKAQVTSESEDARDGREILDLLNPLLVEKGEVTFDGNNPATIYTAVNAWLTAAFARHIDSIIDVYVPNNG